MSIIVGTLLFIAMWWLFSVALFLGVLYVFDRDAASRFVHDVWRWIRL